MEIGKTMNRELCPSLKYLVDGVTDLLRTAGKKGMANVEMTHILLPESKNASGPAFGSYLDKIDDAVYFLEEYVFKE
jgi:hypothetical protein